MANWMAKIQNSLLEISYEEEVNYETVMSLVFRFWKKIQNIVEQELNLEPGKDAAIAEDCLNKADKSVLEERLDLLRLAVLTSPPDSEIQYASLFKRHLFIKETPNLFPEFQMLESYRQFFNGNAKQLETPTFDESASFPYASKLVTVQMTEEMGRHVIASANIHQGDLLFYEDPVASAVLMDREGEFCHHCCRKIHDLVPCDKCITIAYCSEDCKEKDWLRYHCFECRYMKFLQSTGIAYLALRCIFSVGSYNQLITELRQIKPKNNTENEVTISRGYEAFYDLEFQCENLEPDELASCGLMAALLVGFLKLRTNYFPSNIQETALQEFSQLLLQHIFQLICNAHSIVLPIVVLDERLGCQVEQAMVATAIYPSASIMNHSCQPNIVNSFIGNQLLVRAAEAIGAGEAVWNGYEPKATSMRLKDRQEALLQQYGFECRCSACREPFDHLVKTTYDYLIGKTRAGNAKFFKDGFGYYHVNKKTLFCNQRYKINCPAVGVLCLDGAIKFSGEHIHSPDSPAPADAISGPFTKAIKSMFKPAAWEKHLNLKAGVLRWKPDRLRDLYCSNYLFGRSWNNKPLLYTQGYGFLPQNGTSTRYWKCDKKTLESCPVRCHLESNGVLLIKGNHCHNPTTPKPSEAKRGPIKPVAMLKLIDAAREEEKVEEDDEDNVPLKKRTMNLYPKEQNYSIGHSPDGKTVLCENGYGFSMTSKTSYRYWHCDRKTQYQCGVTAVLGLEGVSVKGRHSHKPFTSIPNDAVKGPVSLEFLETIIAKTGLKKPETSTAEETWTKYLIGYSKNGKYAIFKDGFGFLPLTKHSTRLWNCSYRFFWKCPVTAFLEENGDFKIRDVHNHEPTAMPPRNFIRGPINKSVDETLAKLVKKNEEEPQLKKKREPATTGEICKIYLIGHSPEGKVILFNEGNGFIRSTPTGNKNWHCDQKELRQCQVTATLQSAGSLCIIRKHNHPPVTPMPINVTQGPLTEDYLAEWHDLPQQLSVVDVSIVKEEIESPTYGPMSPMPTNVTQGPSIEGYLAELEDLPQQPDKADASMVKGEIEPPLYGPISPMPTNVTHGPLNLNLVERQDLSKQPDNVEVSIVKGEIEPPSCGLVSPMSTNVTEGPSTMGHLAERQNLPKQPDKADVSIVKAEMDLRYAMKTYQNRNKKNI